MAVLVLFGDILWLKTVNSHTGGAMTKPVDVFRSGHTVRLDENSHMVLFPSFSRYITS
jgi:hypothetical protein